ncbi:hypothetical protein BT93_F2813 [Corymbia citriodora subsp. variegata]|nr:hypothetical protein BT93_F2813 [Corymbia citriodora subsp. variegata]
MNIARSCFVVLLICVYFSTNLVQSSPRLQFFVNYQDYETTRYVTVTGCNNNCDTACCDCDIAKQPPVCVKCCKERP